MNKWVIWIIICHFYSETVQFWSCSTHVWSAFLSVSLGNSKSCPQSASPGLSRVFFISSWWSLLALLLGPPFWIPGVPCWSDKLVIVSVLLSTQGTCLTVGPTLMVEDSHVCLTIKLDTAGLTSQSPKSP